MQSTVRNICSTTCVFNTDGPCQGVVSYEPSCQLALHQRSCAAEASVKCGSGGGLTKGASNPERISSPETTSPHVHHSTTVNN